MSWQVPLIVLTMLLLGACGPRDVDASIERTVSEPRRYSGVWVYQFEGSTFLDGVDAVPLELPDYEQAAWLFFNPNDIAPSEKYDDFDEARGCYPVHAFAIEFIGRRVTYPCNKGDLLCGGGHLGLWGSEIEVDELISSKPIPAPYCYGS